MTVQLNPYLNFRNTTREAMEFYQSVFGGTLNISTFADFNAASSPEEAQLIMHSALEAPNGILFFAADTPQHMEYQPGSNFSMSLTGDDESQLREYFDKLADGGQVAMPLEQAPWGDVFGMLTDRFGVRWLVNVSASNS